MNYYEHHIGDYDQATSHLTACEDGIYSRLIRRYYATRKPLPEDLAAVQRLVRARSKEEKKAVGDMLAEFFNIQADGWHQSRCDEDIARYLVKQEKARTSAYARWDKTQCEPDANAMRTQCEGNAPRARSSPQTPITKHQSKANTPPAKARASLLPEDFAISDRVKTWAGKKEFGSLDKHLENFRFQCQAKGYTYIDWDSAFMKAVSQDWAGVRGAAAPDYSAVFATLEDGV